jgi:tetratricopeptide (TPR) repeat protein
MKKGRGGSSREQGKQKPTDQATDSTAAQVAELLEKARVHHVAGRLTEAETLYREMLRVSPDQPDALHLVGVIAHQVGQNAVALELVDAAIQAMPGFAEACFTRGNVLYALKRYEEAVESYDKTLEIHPFHAQAHNNRGGALQALQRFEAALESYGRALALNPDYREARGNRSNALREFALQQSARASRVKTESSGRDLVFYCGPTIEVWNPQTVREKGIGGSEEAILWLSRLLHERGWKVTVYCNCGNEESDYEGVMWKPYWMWNQRDRQDVTVIWRHPMFADSEINAAKLILDLHDAIDESELNAARVEKFHKIFVKSKFHRSLYPNIPDEKFAIVANGIDTTLFHGNEERDPRLLINTSSPDRSLEAFLDCFEEIKKQVPDVKAQWAYGWEMFDADIRYGAQRAEWQAKIVRRIRELGVEDLGRINHSEVAKLYRRGNIFAYPSEFAEIDCISLSKAMAAGAIPIATDFGAMGEKTGHGGVFLPSKKTKDTWWEVGKFHFEMTDPELKAQFVREAVKLLLHPPSEEEREPMREWARGAFDWNAVAETWHEVLRTPSPVAKPVAKTVDELLQEGRAHHIAGRLGDAQTLYREILQASPNHPDALHLLGVIASQIGHYQLGVELIETAIEVKPDFAEAYFSRGNAQYALQQFQAAVESYDKAIELKPLFADARFSRGNALHALGQYGAAMESYDRALELNPGHAEAHNNRGGSRCALRQYAAALEDYDRAILLKPDYAEAHCNRGNVLYALEQYEAALESLDTAIQLQPDNADMHSNRGNALQAMRQYLAALESYDTAIGLNALNADAYNNRGSALHALEQYAAAREDYDKAIELRPDHADAHKNRENSGRALEQYIYFRPDYDEGQERGVFAAARKEAARIAKIEDKAQMKAELDAVPMDIRFHPAVVSLRNLNFVKTESSGRDLVFYCSPPNETWNPETARSKGVGGSEEAVIWLSKLLHERGWNVTVYGNCGVKEKEYDGVPWRPYWMWNWRDKQDVTVLWRYPGCAEFPINSDAVILDLHDVVFAEEFTAKRLKRIDRIFVKSRFHRSLLADIPDETFVILPNGIDAKLFAGDGERDPMLLINTSSADRSMEAFLDCFEEIKKQVPEAKARWAYGWGVWDSKYSSVAFLMEWKATIVRRMEELEVEDLGRISHGEVAELYRKANIFAYPCEFAEIDCISLSKAMAAGAVPITTDFAALGEKTGHGGVFLASKKTKDNWLQPGQFHFAIGDPELKARFVEEAVTLLREPPAEKEREPMREWARLTFDWNAIADRWDEELEGLLRFRRAGRGQAGQGAKNKRL